VNTNNDSSTIKDPAIDTDSSSSSDSESESESDSDDGHNKTSSSSKNKNSNSNSNSNKSFSQSLSQSQSQSQSFSQDSRKRGREEDGVSRLKSNKPVKQAIVIVDRSGTYVPPVAPRATSTVEQEVELGVVQKIGYSVSDLAGGMKGKSLGGRSALDWSHRVEYRSDVVLNDNILYGANILRQREKLTIARRNRPKYQESRNYGDKSLEGKAYEHCVTGRLMKQFMSRNYDLQGKEVMRYFSCVRHNGDLTGNYFPSYTALLERCASYLYCKAGDICFIFIFVSCLVSIYEISLFCLFCLFCFACRSSELFYLFCFVVFYDVLCLIFYVPRIIYILFAYYFILFLSIVSIVFV
jgi:hypothetical protein